jgi:hypothetical protein
MTDNDDFLRALTDRLRSESGCHTVILYGSRARGDATIHSDYDVIGFRDAEGAVVRDAGLWRGGRMDIFVYPTTRLDGDVADMLHVRGGRVLLERDRFGRDLLVRLDEIHARGPEPLPADEIAARKAWAWKMLDRASLGDVEGNFRRAWLLTMLLENHFLLRGQWFPGSKKAFQIFRETDPRTLELFEHALTPDASLQAIAALVEQVNGPRS